MKKIDLRKPLPKTKEPKRVYGTQDLEYDSSPRFNIVTLNDIKNLNSLSSHARIKKVSEQGGGFSLWKEADNTYALAIDKIYVRRNGFINTSLLTDPAADTDYVNIQDNQIVVSRVDDTGTGSAISAFGLGDNSGGIYGAGSGTKNGVSGYAAGTGTGISGNSASGLSGKFTTNVTACLYLISNIVLQAEMYIGRYLLNLLRVLLPTIQI